MTNHSNGDSQVHCRHSAAQPLVNINLFLISGRQFQFWIWQTKNEVSSRLSLSIYCTLLSVAHFQTYQRARYLHPYKDMGLDPVFHFRQDVHDLAALLNLCSPQYTSSDRLLRNNCLALFYWQILRIEKINKSYLSMAKGSMENTKQFLMSHIN